MKSVSVETSQVRPVAVSAATGKPRLTQNQVRSFLNYNWAYGVARVRASIEEHLEILDALEGGNNAQAAELMRSHLNSAKAARRDSKGGDDSFAG